MVFYDSSGKTGVVDDILFQTNTNTTQYPLADITRAVNKGYARTVSLIFKADGRWEYDDPGHAALPIATTDLVANQTNYSILESTYNSARDWLRIQRVEIIDENGSWRVLPQVDKTQLEAYSEAQKTPGTVSCYDLIGNSIFLIPPTSYNYAAGLKVFFDRSPLYFVASDTTKRPGFAEIFHQILSLWGQYYWFTAKDKNRAEQIMRDITVMEKEITDFYSRRNKSEITRLGRTKQSYK